MKLSKLLCLSIFFGFLLIQFSCKKDEPSAGQSLYGKWSWFSSTSKLHGSTITPTTEGYTQSIQFKSSDTVLFWKNDTLTSAKHFSIIHNDSLSNLPIIKLENDPMWMFHFNGDTLYLVNVCSYCFDDKYIRVR